MKYRPEIDGLRAVAVLPVILFHAGFGLFSGGFVGVDVFFVISGYLITSLLLEDIENKRFSLTNFYERRARRILPALFLVMLVCLPFSWAWMLPSQLLDFSNSLMAVSLFVSNILFWRESDYFAPAAEEKPLLHTWSLAVEEQYYLLFPLFLLLAWRNGRNVAFWMVFALALASFALSEWASRHEATANFYLSITRAWELLAGSLAAFIVAKRGVLANNSLAAAGLAAILISIFAYDKSTPFPSAYTLLPVGGVVLLILYARSGTLAAKLLSLKPLVAVGLISYSAYLWHQPLFAFARLKADHPPAPVVFLVLSVAAMGLAFLSWKYVEKPFRQIQNKCLILSFSAVGILGFTLLGLLGNMREGQLNPYMSKPANILWSDIGDRIHDEGLVCNTKAPLRPQTHPNQNWLTGCIFGDLTADRNVVLLGDSHSQAISYELEKTAHAEGFKVHWVFLEGCQPVPALRADKNTSVTDCDTRFEALLSYVKRLSADAIIINRWMYRMFPVDGYNIDMPYKNSEGPIESKSYREFHVLKDGAFFSDPETKTKTLKEYITKVAGVSERTFLVYSVPETAINVSRENWRHWNKTGALLQNLDMPYQDYIRRNAFAASVFDSLNLPNLVRVRPDDVFCNQTRPARCDIQINTTPLYIDDDHLSDAGARLLINSFLEKLRSTH